MRLDVFFCKFPFFFILTIFINLHGGLKPHNSEKANDFYVFEIMSNGNIQSIDLENKNMILNSLYLFKQDGSLVIRGIDTNNHIFRKALHGVFWFLVSKLLIDAVLYKSFDEQGRNGLALVYGILSALSMD